MDSYELNYFKSISCALAESIFEVEKNIISREDFFEGLVSLSRNAKSVSGRLFFIGNGASAAFANHMALDWSKNGGLNAKSLSDSAMLTALSNDYSYEDAFVEYLKIEEVNNNDIVVTISSSGNSNNVVNILKYCKENAIKTIGFSGLNVQNTTRLLSDFSLYVPAKTYGIVECIHQIFLHLWLDKSMNVIEWAREKSQNMNSKDFQL